MQELLKDIPKLQKWALTCQKELIQWIGNYSPPPEQLRKNSWIGYVTNPTTSIEYKLSIKCGMDFDVDLTTKIGVLGVELLRFPPLDKN